MLNSRRRLKILGIIIICCSSGASKVSCCEAMANDPIRKSLTEKSSKGHIYHHFCWTYTLPPLDYIKPGQIFYFYKNDCTVGKILDFFFLRFELKILLEYWEVLGSNIVRGNILLHSRQKCNFFDDISVDSTRISKRLFYNILTLDVYY